jgi:hypothetical protein
MVRNPCPVEPCSPIACRGLEPLIGLLYIAGRDQAVLPGDRTVDLFASSQEPTGSDATTLDAEREIGLQAQCLVRAACIGGMPTTANEGPFGRNATIVKDRLTDEFDLDGALEALDCSNQEVVGVVVHRWPGVRCDDVVRAPWPHGQCIAYDNPAIRGLPRGSQDVGPGS